MSGVLLTHHPYYEVVNVTKWVVSYSLTTLNEWYYEVVNVTKWVVSYSLTTRTMK